MLDRILFLMLSLSSGIMFAQDVEQDILDSDKRDHIESLLKHADEFYKTNLDSALFYINKAKNNIGTYSDTELKAKILLYQSKYLLYKREYDGIIPLLQPNIQNRKLLNDETLGRTYKDIGHAYKQEWIPDSALVNYIKALKCFEKTQNKRDISLTYLALALVYGKIGNTELAESFANKSMNYSTNSKILEMHEKQIKDLKRHSEYDKSLDFSLDIAKIAKERNDLRLLVVAYSDIRNDYFRLQNYEKALEYGEKELALRKQTKFNSLIANNLYFVGNVHLYKGNYKKASDYFDEALLKAPSDSLKLSIYKGLKTAYVNTGNTSKALNFMEQYDALKDSINISRTKTSIAEITSKFNDEQQKQEIKTLSLENEARAEEIANQRLTLFGGLAVSGLLLVLGLLMYRNYRAKQQLSYSQLNFKLLQTQLNPHFMFNALNEINLNLNSENKEETSNHLIAYSKLMRLILEGSDQDFIAVEDDITLISKFLHLQKLVHDNSFEFETIVDKDLDIEMTQIPPMLIQPFVENAILHGVNGVVDGKVEIHYTKNGDDLHILIKDNGKGFNRMDSKSGEQLHQSMGTNIIEQRIKNYKKLYNYIIKIETVSNEGEGTEVRIALPIK
ncbi:tetratricopeptide repeat protein [Winogradskyella sp.]|uniref:tetratricopeptide repeat-containing sensor histidine kinase n=1 Tax=Winogradskyella sp. TaxID=1883156 RepID=UPI00260D45A1|nr:tetratricopeptide repeat protein [Winogradskyella sp.]